MTDEGMTDDEMIDEAALLARVAEAFAAVDPVPDEVRGAALAAFALRGAHPTLAELSVDSADGGVPVGGAAGVRARPGPRRLVFTGPGVLVEIEVTGEGADREIAGRLAPPVSADIVVRHGLGEHPARTDEAGHFVVPAVPAGPVSLVFMLADASSIVTSWVRL